jgi:hypothetical protein
MTVRSTHPFRGFVLHTCAALSLLGCSADATATPPGAGEPTEPAEPAGPPAAVTRAAEPVRTAYASYETLRAALARDAVAEAPSGASAIAKASRAAAGTGTPEQKPRWEALAAAADKLQALPASDADAVRKGFGEVSRALVALLAADPALAEGLHVFKCPMAQGYQKWVQSDPKLANPYMGSQMLTCGSKTSLE